MKRLTMLLVCLFCCTTLVAQNSYVPLLNANNSWKAAYMGCGMWISIQSVTDQDTLIGTTSYKKIKSESDWGGYDYFYAREDLAEKQVFAYDIYTQTERMIYDFSLSVGDVFIYQDLNYTIPQTVTAIDQVQLQDGSWRRRINLAYVSPFEPDLEPVHYNWIEGVGCDSLSTFDYALPFYYSSLICHQSKNQVLWDTQLWDIGCNDMPQIPQEALGNETINNKQVSFYPNPVNDALTVNLGDTFSEVQVQISNLLGQTIQQWTEPNPAETLTIFTNQLPTGVYYVQLSSNHKVIANLKMVKAD